MRRLNGRYANYVNAIRSACGHLWQGRYFSVPMSPRHLNFGLRYVELNPVRAGLIERPQDFAWSSARAHATGRDESGILDMDFWKSRGGAREWTDIVLCGRRSTESSLELAKAMESLLRRCTHAQRPFGDEEFLQEAEEHFNRKWKRLPHKGFPLPEVQLTASSES